MANPDADGDPFRNGTASPDGGSSPDGGAPFVPPDPDEPLFTHASVGTRCVDGVSSEWLVLSRDPVDCVQHADFSRPDSDAFLRVPLSSTPAGALTARVAFCPPRSGCA
ncbi:MAG: hypothetical protein WBG86_00230, partial [Polyangiales bacterium]